MVTASTHTVGQSRVQPDTSEGMQTA